MPETPISLTSPPLAFGNWMEYSRLQYHTARSSCCQRRTRSTTRLLCIQSAVVAASAIGVENFMTRATYKVRFLCLARAVILRTFLEHCAAREEMIVLYGSALARMLTCHMESQFMRINHRQLPQWHRLRRRLQTSPCRHKACRRQQQQHRRMPIFSRAAPLRRNFSSCCSASFQEHKHILDPYKITGLAPHGSLRPMAYTCWSHWLRASCSA